MMTAVPLALSGGGRNTVSEGLWMFFTHQSFACSASLRRLSEPGAPPSQRRMTGGSAPTCATVSDGAKPAKKMPAKATSVWFMAAHLATSVRCFLVGEKKPRARRGLLVCRPSTPVLSLSADRVDFTDRKIFGWDVGGLAASG